MTKRQTKAEQKQIAIQRHLKNLKALGYIPDTLKPIQKLERRAHKFTEDECNGLIDDEDKSRKFREFIEMQVKNLFNKPLRDFYFNGDPRGYALKIDDMNDDTTPLYRDMGGYGILSPDF